MAHNCKTEDMMVIRNLKFGNYFNGRYLIFLDEIRSVDIDMEENE